MKIAVGLSGGVDSSVAAALLLEQGHDVIGVMMKHSQDGKYKTDNRPACFGGDEQEEINAARKVTETLGIPFHVIDLTKEYEEIVLNFFRSEYLAGRTPNPCIKCNQQLKFQLLIDKSKILQDFTFFATGHYARVEFNSMTNRYLLKRAEYIKKDQSYFLSQLTQNQLSRVMFPLGELTKLEVREIAAKYKLPTSDKEESQDFFSGDYKDLFENLPPKGDIVDGSGKILGRHSGIISYTIGQRKGLGIS
ncbi:MAG: tRNA 2-thiouridine(34) synthase MnmA, partial [Spirochaetales bacterium]|nr:tRNA 2-thiouridine(34) synthase MnmA [Spirochaetales bacterium]